MQAVVCYCKTTHATVGLLGLFQRSIKYSSISISPHAQDDFRSPVIACDHIWRHHERRSGGAGKTEVQYLKGKRSKLPTGECNDEMSFSGNVFQISYLECTIRFDDYVGGFEVSMNDSG